MSPLQSDPAQRLEFWHLGRVVGKATVRLPRKLVAHCSPKFRQNSPTSPHRCRWPTRPCPNTQDAVGGDPIAVVQDRHQLPQLKLFRGQLPQAGNASYPPAPIKSASAQRIRYEYSLIGNEKIPIDTAPSSNTYPNNPQHQHNQRPTTTPRFPSRLGRSSNAPLVRTEIIRNRPEAPNRKC